MLVNQLNGSGKPGAGTSAMVSRNPLGDERGNIINDNGVFIMYFVSKEAPPTATTPASTPTGTDSTTQQAIDAGMKLKGMLGL